MYNYKMKFAALQYIVLTQTSNRFGEKKTGHFLHLCNFPDKFILTSKEPSLITIQFKCTSRYVVVCRISKR